MKERRNISATPEQWAIIDRLAEDDAKARRDERADRSRTLVDLALAEDKRRGKGRIVPDLSGNGNHLTGPDLTGKRHAGRKR